MCGRIKVKLKKFKSGDEYVDINEVMKNLIQGLTGNVQEDIIYLQAKLEECKDQEGYEEILDACVGLLLEAFPEADVLDLKELLTSSEFGVSSVLLKASELMYSRNYLDARNLLEELIERIESSNKYQDNDYNEYRSFNNLIEVLLYDKTRNSTKEVHDVAEHIGEVYCLYGDVLNGLNEKEMARNAYKRGLSWNPVFTKLLLAYAATFRNPAETDRFALETLRAFKYAYTKEELANCYCNLGDYHAQAKRWLPARACYLLGSKYEKNGEEVHKRLIMAENETKDLELTTSRMAKLSSEYNFPLKPNGKVIETVIGVAKHFVKEEQTDLARYFLTLAKDLTVSEEIEKLLEKLPKAAN